jgi:hypothetical protein
MNLKKLMKILKGSRQAVDLLDQAGINVDRLIGISNAQGPQGRIIKTVISTIAENMESEHSDTDTLETDVKQLNAKPQKPRKTGSKSKSSKKTTK